MTTVAKVMFHPVTLAVYAIMSIVTLINDVHSGFPFHVSHIAMALFAILGMAVTIIWAQKDAIHADIEIPVNQTAFNAIVTYGTMLSGILLAAAQILTADGVGNTIVIWLINYLGALIAGLVQQLKLQEGGTQLRMNLSAH